MNTSFTPGSWSVFNPRLRTNPSSEHRLLVVHPDGERIIARMDEGFVNGKGTMTLKEREANARLIAASPDLLSAIQEMYSMFYAHEQYDDNSAAAVKLARASINLATGQEP